MPGLTVFPSQGNFFLVKLPTEWSGVALRDFLVANHGVYTRECGNKLGMTSQFMRMVVRPPRDVDRLIDGMMDYGRQFMGRSRYDEEPMDNRRGGGGNWNNNMDDVPDNLIQYPSRRTEYTARRAANG
ncbi:hypothetical protein [Paractinoplanes durhamensis]|uniref:hypothetical protein n=1 Tax=Paractinoplanes durhamensis TaxID=113563 RepID=UPI003636A4F8